MDLFAVLQFGIHFTDYRSLPDVQTKCSHQEEKTLDNYEHHYFGKIIYTNHFFGPIFGCRGLVIVRTYKAYNVCILRNKFKNDLSSITNFFIS